MKAITLSKYGSPSYLTLTNLPKPVPKDNQVLIKIYASSVNDYDLSLVKGKPYIYRIMYGILKPKIKIPGAEIAGIVEKTGKDIKNFHVGDSVFGDISTIGLGGFAEYISVPEDAIALMPENIDFAQAASLPHASLLAMQAMVQIGKIKPKENILINGAGGGVGTIGLQIAKQYACNVTGVDKGFKLDALKKLGFDKVIDYEKIDFTQTATKYDLIIDTKTNRNTWRYLKALKPEGRYITVGGHLPKLLQIVLMKTILKKFTGKKLDVLALSVNKGLDEIKTLYKKKALTPVLDRIYDLEDAGKAVQRFSDSAHIGKIIISINQTPS